MESPVVLDKPPEYHANDRGFPFEDEESSGAWSELAARHPDIAARLRQRPASATWARKRRPSSQDATDDFGENFGSFDRFPFDDIPPEFREHFPSHWNRRFGSREEAPPPPSPQASPPTGAPQQHTAATQTDRTQGEAAPTDHPQTSLPQYGLRNTVDLGQKSAADPSLVDAEERTHRSMSAPPDRRPPPPHPHPHPADMSSQQPERPAAEHGSNVRHIPIFVEGRDEPVLNRAEPTKQPPPPPPPFAPHVDRDQYFADEAGAAGFHHAPNFTRAFGSPSTKGFRQGPQPFMQQKVYPQNAFARGASPQRSQSPRPAPAPAPAPQQEHFVKVPVHHEHAAPPRAATSPEPTPHREQTPPKAPPKPSPNDPITQILSIQTDVLNLMTEVENFASCKKDKRYLFLDEMLTRNLIKLDNIETEGKENIRLARKEAIRCIQKCIAVLEAKAESNTIAQKASDVEMKDPEAPKDKEAENGEVEMKDELSEPLAEQTETKLNREEAALPTQEQHQEVKLVTQEPEAAPAPAPDTQPQEESNPSEDKPEEQQKEVEDKPSPKKKVIKKRDKSKDKAPADGAEAAKDKLDEKEVMQVDSKGDKTEQVMEVDGAASQ